MTAAAEPTHDAPLSSPVAGGVTRTGAPRIDGIDMLRGLVICLMVLDHVRDFLHPSVAFDALDPDLTNPALFATRWITHFCAPTFVLLAGVGAYLQRFNGKSPGRLSRFLLTRGLWLVVLELTVIGFGWQFYAPAFVFLQVIWAIGWSMVLLSVLTGAPPRALLVLGGVILLGRLLLEPVSAEALGAWGPVWTVLMGTGMSPVGGVPVLVVYSVLPWFGIACLGYGLGSIFTLETAARRRALTALGLSMTGAFLILRGLPIASDPHAWETHSEVWKTIGDFLDVRKNPPSPLYALMTLGPALALLPWLERLKGSAASFLLAFGRAPLFAYVLHIYVAHLAAMGIGVAMGYPASAFVNSLFRGPPEGWGLSLSVTYGVWLAILVLLYPVVRWFAGVKTRRRDWWLGYL
jgi:uncharacterized membrane protein